jgi:ABC-2 type transport system ATP-binding protein
MSDAIVADELRKRYAKTKALDGLSLKVTEGSVHGLLGPNGAGKTTAVRVLTTLLRPDSGTATVCGVDVVREPNRARRLIGLTGQFTAVDELLTGVENLELVGRLYRLGRAEARARTAELIDALGLAEHARKLVKTYSGGLRRRLDLAASLISRPRVLFLDEPTTGLDVRSRLALWAAIKGLVSHGTTVLLTTQYLEEADYLAHAITVIDHGRVIAAGTPDELKDALGGNRIELRLADPTQLAAAAGAVRAHSDTEPTTDPETATLTVPLSGGDAGVVPFILRDLGAARVRSLTERGGGDATDAATVPSMPSVPSVLSASEKGASR